MTPASASADTSTADSPAEDLPADPSAEDPAADEAHLHMSMTVKLCAVLDLVAIHLSETLFRQQVPPAVRHAVWRHLEWLGSLGAAGALVEGSLPVLPDGFYQRAWELTEEGVENSPPPQRDVDCVAGSKTWSQRWEGDHLTTAREAIAEAIGDCGVREGDTLTVDGVTFRILSVSARALLWLPPYQPSFTEVHLDLTPLVGPPPVPDPDPDEDDDSPQT